jgi:hypothetical protein
MRTPLMQRFALLCLILLLVASGCQPPPPGTIPVTGTVTLDAQPLAGANVSFIPQGETTGQGGMGQTDAQGRFTVHLHNNQSTAKGPPGLFAGQYKVIISKLVNPDGTPFIATEDVAPIDSNAKDLVPEAYSNFDLSQLTADVQPPDTKADFNLRSSSASRP